MSTDNFINNEEVSISPNPFTDKFNISSQQNFEYAALYDATGKLIHTQNFAKTIELKNLSQGVYFLHLIDSEGKKVVKKLVKE